MIVAKPVIPDQYWILRQDDRKIGNIEAEAGVFKVKINNRTETFATLPTIKKKIGVDFVSVDCSTEPAPDQSVYGYSTTSTPYNAVYDVKHQVPLWTPEPRSRSWHAAGWYQVKQGRSWSVVHCPKLIVIQRYPYRGPFYTQEQAQAAR